MKKVLLSSLVMFAVSLSAFGQTPNFASGFASTTGLTLNGFGSAAKTSGSRLRLTDGGLNEARSAFFSTPVNVQSFTNDFSFQLTKASADGFTFTIQGIGPTALGAPGGALGYGPTSTGTIPGIGSSVAVGFQLYSKALGNIEVSLTGDWTNGALPSLNPGSSTTASGVNLHSGDVMSVHMTYDGTTLTWTITDSTVGKSFTNSVIIDIPSLALSSTAYVGFTAGTGGLAAVQDILSWTYTSTQGVATPSISPASSAQSSPVTVTLNDTTPGATITYTTDGSTPVPGSNGTAISSGGSFSLSFASTATVNAVASASGFTNSAIATATYTSQPPAATPSIAPASSAQSSPVTVTLNDTTPGATITYTTDGSTPVPGSNGTAISSGGSFSLSFASTATVNAIASASGFTNSAIATATYTIQSSGGGGSPNFPNGFPSTGSGLTLNGFGSVSAFSGTRLRLTNGGATEARSAFFSTLVNVQSFITDFNFQLANGTNPSADGITFTIQSSSPSALGAPGGALGYGPTTGISGIGSSVAVKFDLYSNSGEGTNSTGLYTNGASPTLPATTISGGVSLHSGHVMSAHLAYDGTTLTLIITDTSTNASFSTTFAVDIPGTVGGNSAYVGFTGGTGGLTATQDILTWRYNPVPVMAFTWPVSTPITYAPSNCGPPNDYSFYCSQNPIFGQYHTGIDVCPSSPGCAIGNPVSASSSGIVELALVVSDPTEMLCDGSPTTGYQINPSSSNLGNVIVIAHPNGKFTVYGHLDCIWPGVVPGLQVAAGTRIANMGHSGNGQRDRTFVPHTHFEMKDRAVTGDSTNLGYSGYTSDLPDGYGYHDARIYINPFSISPLTPTAVKVVAASAQTVFTGPDPSFAALATVAPNQEFVASTTSGSWYRIDMPNDNGPVSGWVQGGASLVTADPTAILLQVTGASSGLTLQVGPASGTNLLSWDYTHSNCKPTAKVWNGQQYVSLGSQNGFNEFYLPLNYYFSSANSCAEPSGSGPSIGWASSTFLH